MIDGLCPYVEYKDSGLPWLPRIPASWSLARNGRLFTQRNRTGASDLPILEVSLRSGVRVRDMEDGGRKQVMSDRGKYKQARAGDIAYNTMRMWQGAVGVAPVDGLVSPAYVVASPGPEINAHYATRLYRTAEYMREIDTYSRGIVKDRNRLYWEAFKQIPTPLPPRQEQDAIVRFLAHSESRVHRAIAAKQALIAHLDEQRRTLIQFAVTGALADTPRTIASGSRFVGALPDGWRALRLRNVADLRASNVDKRSVPGEIAVRLCNYVDVYRQDTIRSDMSFMAATATSAEVARFGLRVGDVLITKDSEEWLDIGVPALMESTAPDLVCGYHVAILRPRPHIDPQFLFRCFQSAAISNQLSVFATGVTRYGLSQSAIKDVLVPVPPVDEQHRIATWLRAATAHVDRAIARTRADIALLREYQMRIVADVVTGQFDVRAAVDRLPDVVHTVDTADELKTPEEIDTSAEHADLPAAAEAST